MIKINAVGYLMTFIVYFIFSDGSRAWGGFSICTQLCFYCFSMFLILKQIKPDRLDQILLRHTIYITLFRSFYTAICIFYPSEIVFFMTDCFTKMICVYVGILFFYLIYLHIQLYSFKSLIKCVLLFKPDEMLDKQRTLIDNDHSI